MKKILGETTRSLTRNVGQFGYLTKKIETEIV